MRWQGRAEAVGLPEVIYYARISDGRQDNLRQVDGLRDLAKREGDDIPEHLWQMVLDKLPMPPGSPVLWDFGSRDQPETRPNFMAIMDRVKRQRFNDPYRLRRLNIHELDRFGVKGAKHWFACLHEFEEGGCEIVSAMEGSLMVDDDDLAELIKHLFKSSNSRAEQKKTAGRVAETFGLMGLEGKHVGGIPRFGYDKGCLDKTRRLLWRLHYLNPIHKIQIMATPSNPLALPDGPGAEPIEYKGKNNTVRKSDEQDYIDLLSCDTKRVETVRFMFSTYRREGNALKWNDLNRRMAALGFVCYDGRPFDAEYLPRMLADPTYNGRKTTHKRTAAKHKRFTSTRKNDEGRPIEDVPREERPDPKDARKVKTRDRWRPREEWLIPEEQTHDAISDDEEFEAVQKLLAERPKRPKKGEVGKGMGRAPRHETHWLKPIMFCDRCKHGMRARTNRKLIGYSCLCYEKRYTRPNDPRYKCDAGLNWIAHEQVEQAVMTRLGDLSADVTRAVEVGAIERLESQVAAFEREALTGADEGLRGHLLTINEALGLDEQGGPASDLVRAMLATDDPADRQEMLVELEKLVPLLAVQILDQCREEHRHYTLGLHSPKTPERQKSVLQAECDRLDRRIELLERVRAPYQEHVEELAARYRDALARLGEARRAMETNDLLAKGAAAASVFFRIYVSPSDKVNSDAQRLRMFLRSDALRELGLDEVRDSLGWLDGDGHLVGTPWSNYGYSSPWPADFIAGGTESLSTSGPPSRNLSPSPLHPRAHGSPRSWYPSCSQ